MRSLPGLLAGVSARALVDKYVPILGWLPAYPRQDLRADVIAGLTSWGVMVPVAIAYAQIASVPPQVGLATAFGALLGYAAFGTCRQLKVTTSSSMAIMSAAVIAPLAVGDAGHYLVLSAGLALVVGLVLVVAGFVRLGFISDFLSKSVVTGFVFGLAITILVGQLPKLFGLTAGGGNVFQQLWHLLWSLGDTGWALLVGGGALVTTLKEGEIQVLLAQVRGAVRDRLRVSGLMGELGESHFFASVADAVDYLLVQPR
jgi:sulfate permease, SulP family